MEAYSVRVTYADSSKLDFYAWASYEKNELFVGASARLVNFAKAVHLDSEELAMQYRDAIIDKQRKKGHSDFEAEVEQIWSRDNDFAKSIENDSKIVREKLAAWNSKSRKQ